MDCQQSHRAVAVPVGRGARPRQKEGDHSVEVGGGLQEVEREYCVG